MSELSAYEKEIYAFLTQPENFKGMILAASQVEMVKRNLVLEFWTELELAMATRVQQKPDWHVLIVNKSAHPLDWRMRIYKTKWNPRDKYEVCWGCEFENGKLFYGIINNQDEMRHPIIREQLDANPGDWKSEFTGRPTPWYPAWGWEGLKLLTNEDYEELLSGRRKDYIDRIAERMALLLEKVTSTIDSIFDSLE